MKKQSNDNRRHHYVPILHLKGFTDESGELKVYDKKINSFIKKKKTPRTIMFENDRNTIKVNGVETKALEAMYGTFENNFGKLFNMLREGLSVDSENHESVKEIIKVHLAYQFWRSPALDSFADDYILNLDLKAFGNRVTIDGKNFGDNEEFKKVIQTDKSLRYAFRCFWLPILTFNIETKLRTEFKISILNVSGKITGWNNIICTDFPIIIDNKDKFFNFESSFIFPLSKNKLLIGHDKSVESIPAIFTTYLSMLSYGESLRYITGENKEYMSEIISFYEKMSGSNQQKNDLLRKDIFKMLS